MAVGIYLRIAQLGGNPIFQLLGNEVLQSLRFFVNFIPRIVKDIVQKTLQQPVMPKDFQRPFPAVTVQKDTMMLFVLDE
jgi:hypothetical protein